MFVTTWVLGDPGANAADIFPRLALQQSEIEKVIVADFPKNKFHIVARQGVDYLRLEWGRTWLRYAARIALKARREQIDIIHVFYRQQNAVLLIFTRLFLLLLARRTRLIMDHRSVNLAKGARRFRKIALNQIMQFFAHNLAGNPWAVETNHWMIFRPKYVIDLGYDQLPLSISSTKTEDPAPVDVWFIGSLKPRNRKSEFLLDIFDRINALQAKRSNLAGPKVRFRVAGVTNAKQRERLLKNPSVIYYGKMQRSKLYKELQKHPGIGLAYMNSEYHHFAPSLKFAEYAAMRFSILASDTIGLRTQARRMGLPGVSFFGDCVEAWVNAIGIAAADFQGPEPVWEGASNWSYASIFKNQVVELYKDMCVATRVERSIPLPP
ncbi:MAG: hypothetical protein AAF754_01410 [Pseudomonadota bacterium]